MNSYTFVVDIVNFPNNNYVMASYDVKSLFTNIPIDETCKIVLDKLFPKIDDLYLGYNRTDFAKMLENFTKSNIFLFNGQTYLQTDGCPMGGCIFPALGCIFLCHHETMWLDNCVSEFKPVLYKRYVDDTFSLIR